MKSVCVKTAAGKILRGISDLITAIEPFSPVLIAFVYFQCNKDFIGIQYGADEFGYLSKMILLSGRDIIFPSWWRFGYSLFLLPVAWLTKNQCHFWYNFVIYQSLIWCAIFYMVRYFITFLRPDITVARRFLVLLLCAAYPSWCIVTGYAFTTTVMVFFYMAIISLLCRWNGTSFFEPLAAAVLAGLLYWIHPLGLAVYIPLVIAVFFGRKGSMKRCVVQVVGVVAALVLFCILYKVLSSVIDARMSNSYSCPMNYISGWRNDIKLMFIPCFFLSHLSTLGLTTLGAAFCGLSAACHQMLGAFFKKIGSPLPEHATNIVSFCALCVFAVAAESALYFICLAPIPVYGSYYHWVYCRYLENVSLPLLVLCFLVKWKAVYFILPCVTFLSPYFGLKAYVTNIFDNQINVISLAVKNVCEYYKLLKGTEQFLLTMHLLISFIVISAIGLCARFKITRKVFFCLFLFAAVIGITKNLKRHDKLTLGANRVRRFALAVEKTKAKTNVTWDSFHQRNRRHISNHEVFYPYVRSAFWRAKWELGTTENWLKEKKGILITDFTYPLLRHSDLYVYRLPFPPFKYIVAKTPLPDCEAYAASAFWEKKRWIKPEQIMYRYAYALNKLAHRPYMVGIYFSAFPETKYLYVKLSNPVGVTFFLNGKKLDSLTGDHGLMRCFDVSNAIRQYNELSVRGTGSLTALPHVAAVKLDDELTAEAEYFTGMSSPYKLHVAGSKNAAVSGNDLAVSPNQIQCGPRISLPPGTWRVEIRGKNLHQGAFVLRFTHRRKIFSRIIKTAEISPNLVRYFFSHEQQLGLFEFLCRNMGKSNIIVEGVTLKCVPDTGKAEKHITKIPYMMPFFPFNRQISFSLSEPCMFGSGFRFVEPSGYWAKKESSLEIHFSEVPKSRVELRFSLIPSTKDQIMIIKTPDGKHLKTFEVSRTGTYVLALDQAYFSKYGGNVRLNMSFPRAAAPEPADKKALSCSLKSIEARLCDDLDVGQEVVFSKLSPFCLAGFSAPESWGTWGSAKNSVMRIPLPKDRKSETIRLRFTCRAYKKMKSVKIFCNGKYAAAWNIRKFTPNVYDLNLTVPLTERNMELRFEQFDIASPYEVSGAADDRKLGLGFVSMKRLL